MIAKRTCKPLLGRPKRLEKTHVPINRCNLPRKKTDKTLKIFSHQKFAADLGSPDRLEIHFKHIRGNQ